VIAVRAQVVIAVRAQVVIEARAQVVAISTATATAAVADSPIGGLVMTAHNVAHSPV